MMYHMKGTALNGPHVVGGGGVGGGDTFYSPVIESQSSGEPVALHYEPQKYFSAFFPSPLRWGSMAGVG